MMITKELEQLYPQFREVFSKLDCEDLRIIALLFDTGYHGKEPIWDDDGKRRYLEDFWGCIREYHKNRESLTSVWQALNVLKNL